MCDCCDHPLEHAILVALDSRQYVGSLDALDRLKDDYESWKDDQ